jgi:hypothetical protein
MPESVAGAVADRLFSHLEIHPRLIQSKRIEHILGLLSRLGESDRDWIAFTQLREALGRYEWRYGLTLSTSGLRARLFFTTKMSEEDEWEYEAVRFLLGLVPHLMNRLRRCAYDRCKGWFFAARRQDQKFCKRGTCRQNHYDTTPEMREHKKLYMQMYRKEEKKRQERRNMRLAKRRAHAETKRSTKKSLR